ncbi:hypothetical protein BH24ACT26_BH24ACT26_16040 [soil metagenome]
MTETTALEAALEALDEGSPIVVPTDTVYGLAARPSLARAIEAVFRVKGRPPDKPLPLLAARLDDLLDVVTVDARARMAAARFWPGPLTLVLPRAAGFPFDLGGGRAASIAVRVPSCPVALALLRRSGPLAVTSANRSGQAPATTVQEARAALEALVEVFLDGGRLAGRPSTILSLVDAPIVLREGALTAEEVMSVARRE